MATKPRLPGFVPKNLSEIADDLRQSSIDLMGIVSAANLLAVKQEELEWLDDLRKVAQTLDEAKREVFMLLESRPAT